MSRLSVLKNEILPLAMKNICLELVKCEQDETIKGENQYSSNVIFLKVKAKSKNSDDGVITLPVVVKFQIDDKIVREWLKFDEQFYNEIFIYEKMIPLLNNTKKNIVSEIFPKFYYGVGTLGKEPEKDILILENLRMDGFRLTDERVFLDYDHIVMALKQLGRFHALSYAAKEENEEQFFNNVNLLVECRYCEDTTEYWYYLFKYAVQKVFDLLINDSKYNSVINNYYNKINNTKQLLLSLLQPEEPTAVIVHGDFCRNNIFYKYNKQGKPIDIKFFDLATARYSSPTIDLCFFLFLNASSELRRQHWDEFLTLYHESLSSTVPGIKVPSLDDLQAEIRSKGIFGFLLCSFFLPQMAAGIDFVPTEMTEMTFEERGKDVASHTGEKEMQLAEELFVELVERKILT